MLDVVATLSGISESPFGDKFGMLIKPWWHFSGSARMVASAAPASFKVDIPKESGVLVEDFFHCILQLPVNNHIVILIL